MPIVSSQGAPSFSTLIFHDFSMTKKMKIHVQQSCSSCSVHNSKTFPPLKLFTLVKTTTLNGTHKRPEDRKKWRLEVNDLHNQIHMQLENLRICLVVAQHRHSSKVAKIQSKQTNTQLSTGQMSFLSPNRQCQSTEGKILLLLLNYCY